MELNVWRAAASFHIMENIMIFNIQYVCNVYTYAIKTITDKMLYIFHFKAVVYLIPLCDCRTPLVLPMGSHILSNLYHYLERKFVCQIIFAVWLFICLSTVSCCKTSSNTF